MGNENGEWIMHGLRESDPDCIRTVGQLEEYINAVGFLPLFKNGIDGFSVEEHTSSLYWWSGDAERDPWEWRAILARRGNLAYGKFFDKKAGFISKDWLPTFINYRRDGYDFDARWEDEKASVRQKKLMDPFDTQPELFSYELKERSGFGKGGEKNFEGVLTALQMELYLCVRDFRCRRNKHGEPYGWAIAVYTKPETLWGELCSASYSDPPTRSRQRIAEQLHRLYPDAAEKDVLKMLG